MTTPRIDTVQAWRGRSMVDPAGGTIGTLSDIYLDDDTAQPEWATVTTGLFGTRQSFVPLAEEDVDQRHDVRDTAVGGDLSGLTTDDATTRSEKELGVGTTQRERGPTRLRKYVTTE